MAKKQITILIDETVLKNLDILAKKAKLSRNAMVSLCCIHATFCEQFSDAYGNLFGKEANKGC